MTYPHIVLEHIPDEHLRGVGLVSQASAYLEGAIERICWLMGGVQRESLGQAFTTYMTVPSLYNAALALVDAQFPNSAPYAALKGLRNNVTSQLSGKRNEIVHSRLHGLEEFNRTFRVVYKARGKVNKDTIPVDIEEYEILAKEIVATTNEIIDILNELVEMVRERDGAPPPWTQRP